MHVQYEMACEGDCVCVTVCYRDAADCGCMEAGIECVEECDCYGRRGNCGNPLGRRVFNAKVTATSSPPEYPYGIYCVMCVFVSTVGIGTS